MKLDDAIKHIIDGNAMLFLGAGFSYEALNNLDKKMGLAKELSYDLCKEMGKRPNENLSVVSNVYLKNADNKTKLIEKLQDYFICKDFKKYHEIIAKQSWNRVYTTNYDDVFEKASRRNKLDNEYRPKTLKDSTKNINTINSVIHLNGYIRKLTEDALENEFKLTTKSYMVEEFLNSDWCGLFKMDMRNAEAIIFIGTSFKYDLDLQRILYEDKELRDKTIFIDKKMEDGEIEELEDTVREEFGDIYKIGVEGFANEIEKMSLTYVKNSQTIKFRSFEHVNEDTLEYFEAKVRDKWDLLVLGKINKNILYSNIDNDNYIFNRTISKEIDQAFNKDMNVVVVHGNLGKGKTCLVNRYIYSIKGKGEIFFLKDNLANIDKEIMAISKIKGIKYIVIENYTYYKEILKKFKPVFNDEYRFILTARTFLNETMYYQLPRILGVNEDKICRISLNMMMENDIRNLVGLLDSSTIWNDDPRISDNHNNDSIKYDIISKECNNDLDNVLMNIVKSESVSKEIDKLYNKIGENRIKKNLLLGVIINSTAALDLSLRDIASVIGLNSISLNIENDTELNQLIDLQGNNIKAKSSIFAQYLIEKNNLSKDVLDVMKLMVINANKMKFGKNNNIIIRQLNSISNINEIITKKSHNVKKEIVEYFDSIKEFTFYKDSPFFWLQYGMACLDAQEYDRTEKYFNVAYNKAEKITYYFDTYQIDTQYARYLMESAIYNHKDVKNPYDILSRANNILIETLAKRRGQSYYIFKQVPNYLEFVKTFVRKLSSKEKNNIISMCNNMNERIEDYKVKNDNVDLNSTLGYAENALKKCKQIILLSATE